MIIYKATNLKNNKVYIGLTVRTLAKRKIEHYRQNRYGKPTYFSYALHKYNEEDFIWEIIEECSDKNTLCIREMYWIDYYSSTDPKKGYNISSGGDMNSLTKEYRSTTMKNVVRKSNYINPFKNKTHTIETRNHLSKIRKGRKALNKNIPMSEIQKDELRKKALQRNKNKNKITFILEQPTSKCIICIETNTYFLSILQCSRETNVSTGSIYKVLKGKQSSIKGYSFRYATIEEKANYLRTIIQKHNLDESKLIEIQKYIS